MSKSDGLKLPKSIAGVKIPKALRKSGALDLLVATPESRQLLADAIVAAARAAAAVIVAHEPEDGKAEPNGAEERTPRSAGRRSDAPVADDQNDAGAADAAV